jgi:hypothetical protein
LGLKAAIAYEYPDNDVLSYDGASSGATMISMIYVELKPF